MKVILMGYAETKYEAEEEAWERVYEIESYEVREIPEQEILRETDGSMVDENNEYLILVFKDGDTATFRNSHVDMFKLH